MDGLNSDKLVQSNLQVGPELLEALRKEKWPVVKYPGFPIIRNNQSR